MIEVNATTITVFVIYSLVTLGITICGILMILRIRDSEKKSDKEDFYPLICMVRCGKRVTMSELLYIRLQQIGLKEYIKSIEEKKGKEIDETA